MTPLAILGASLLGSLHCAAMCGAFAAMCGGVGPGRVPRQALAYSLGRGVAYIGLGGLAGGIGAGIDLAGLSLAGVSESAALLLGTMLIGLGLWSLVGRRGTSVGLVTLGATARPGPLARLRMRLAPLLQRSGLAAAAGVGLLSALLPCAWLWSFLAVAAATAQAGDGALVMLAFWAGTVPALTGVGLLAGTVGRRLGRHAPRIVAAIMIALGAAALVGRASLSTARADAPCHAEESD